MLQFDRHAEAYDAIRGKIAYPERLYRRLAAGCRDRGAALDLGCGNGASTAPLAAFFRVVEGVDHGDRLLELARSRHPTIRFHRSPVEAFEPDRTFDLVTCATAFYWMDRPRVLERAARWLDPGGLFCAYRYDFPKVPGPVGAQIRQELAERWDRHRDPRLVAPDDTADLLRAAGWREVERLTLPNPVTLSPREVALFFLSTSYVTRWCEEAGDEGYGVRLIESVCAAAESPEVVVGFDLDVVIGRPPG